MKRIFGINNVYVVENVVNKLKLHINTKRNDILKLVYIEKLSKIHNPDVVFKPINTIKEKFDDVYENIKED